MSLQYNGLQKRFVRARRYLRRPKGFASGGVTYARQLQRKRVPSDDRPVTPTNRSLSAAGVLTPSTTGRHGRRCRHVDPNEDEDGPGADLNAWSDEQE